MNDWSWWEFERANEILIERHARREITKGAARKQKNAKNIINKIR